MGAFRDGLDDFVTYAINQKVKYECSPQRVTIDESTRNGEEKNQSMSETQGYFARTLEKIFSLLIYFQYI
jgi:hypothetical protein